MRYSRSRDGLVFDQAFAHGRFQPPHYGHLEYLLTAKALAKELWIGLVSIPQSLTEDALMNAPLHRHRKHANPLTFTERERLLTTTLAREGVPRHELRFVEFPLGDRDAMLKAIPRGVVGLTTIYEEWNREKIAFLESCGYRIEILYERSHKKYEGVRVRRAILENSSEWRGMVPPAVASFIEEVDLARRLGGACDLC